MKALLDEAALIYDAGQHGGLEPVASYPGRGGERHEVCINQHPDLDWRVIDLGPDGSATLVGRLDGLDDLRRQAVACAEDYATQCRLFHAGWRADPPILRPKQMQMNYRDAQKRPPSDAIPTHGSTASAARRWRHAKTASQQERSRT